MTSFQTIRRCFAKLDANNTLLIIIFAAFQLFARSSAALPVVTYTGQYASRFGPHSSPGWLPAGDKILVFAIIDSSDPIGSPTISVEAVQGGTSLTLDDPKPEDSHREYDKFIDFDPGLAGFWQITPTDSSGAGPSSFTNAIVEPEFLPLVEDNTVQGTPLGARVAWTLPNLDGFDIDATAVRFYEVASGDFFWESELLSVQTTSFQVPAGVLQAGVDYVSVVLLGDFEGSYVENASWTFSVPFRFTALAMNGDFNLDGTVDSADYVVWRNGPGTVYTQAAYNVWRSHFGQTAGSGSALPSADPLSAAVPEPATLVLLILACIGIKCRRTTAFVS